MKIIKYRLLICIRSVERTRIDIDENKFCLSIDILSIKNNTLNFPLKSYLLIYDLPF